MSNAVFARVPASVQAERQAQGKDGFVFDELADLWQLVPLTPAERLEVWELSALPPDELAELVAS